MRRNSSLLPSPRANMWTPEARQGSFHQRVVQVGKRDLLRINGRGAVESQGIRLCEEGGEALRKTVVRCRREEQPGAGSGGAMRRRARGRSESRWSSAVLAGGGHKKLRLNSSGLHLSR